MKTPAERYQGLDPDLAKALSRETTKRIRFVAETLQVGVKFGGPSAAVTVAITLLEARPLNLAIVGVLSVIVAVLLARTYVSRNAKARLREDNDALEGENRMLRDEKRTLEGVVAELEQQVEDLER